VIEAEGEHSAASFVLSDQIQSVIRLHVSPPSSLAVVMTGACKYLHGSHKCTHRIYFVGLSAHDMIPREVTTS